MIERAFVPSPLGIVMLAADRDALTELRFADDTAPRGAPPSKLLRAAASAIDAYFAGERRTFELPLAPKGTPFQQAVWRELVAIPLGETRTYGQLAIRLGRPTASRAVGAANGQNPISIIMPCHRVIGSNGALTGYAYGVHRKAWLLRHEAAKESRDSAPGPAKPDPGPTPRDWSATRRRDLSAEIA